jgi:hypothetical protein
VSNIIVRWLMDETDSHSFFVSQTGLRNILYAANRKSRFGLNINMAVAHGSYRQMDAGLMICADEELDPCGRKIGFALPKFECCS